MKFTRFSGMFLLFLTVAIFMISVDPSTAQQPPCGGGQRSTGPGQSGKSGLDDFNRAFIDACRSMNHEAAAQLWADDGVDLLPGMEPMVGKPEISKWLLGLGEKMKGVKVLQCDVDWKETRVAGDVAYEWGINTQTVSVPDRSEPVKNKGKITLILRKQTDGSWKLALESWNVSPQ
jgi:uncharacterized protein (TIGR02246 family)